MMRVALLVMCDIVVRAPLGVDVFPPLLLRLLLPPVHDGDILLLLLLLLAALVRHVPPLGLGVHVGLMAALAGASSLPGAAARRGLGRHTRFVDLYLHMPLVLNMMVKGCGDLFFLDLLLDWCTVFF